MDDGLPDNPAEWLASLGAQRTSVDVEVIEETVVDLTEE
jgi:hypothetical protein